MPLMYMYIKILSWYGYVPQGGMDVRDFDTISQESHMYDPASGETETVES
jgi:hypothetical protein